LTVLMDELKKIKSSYLLKNQIISYLNKNKKYLNMKIIIK